jgi:hypothetical protein
MKLRRLIFSVVLLLSTLRTFAQGTLEFDQQSSTGGFFEGVIDISSNQPTGQSFTPALSGIGVVQLALAGQNPGNNANANVYVNLLTSSITGPILAQTGIVAVPIGFEGTVNFFFPTQVALTPGTTYYLQPVVQSGDAVANISTFYHYSGGTSFIDGTANPSENFYFREGLVTAPEPSTWALLALGGGAFFFHRRKVA